MSYPAWEIPYWKVYYSKEPSQKQSNEYLLTQLLNMFHHANSTKSDKSISDFAVPDLWKPQKQAEDKAILNLFRKIK